MKVVFFALDDMTYLVDGSEYKFTDVGGRFGPSELTIVNSVLFEQMYFSIDLCINML